MTVEDAVAELQRMASEVGVPPAVVIGPDPLSTRPPSPSPSVPIDAPEVMPRCRPRRFRCGSGDGCDVWLERRGLCESHAEAIRSLKPRRGRPRSLAKSAREGRRAAEAKVEQMANAVVACVTAATSHPVSRAAVAQAAGVSVSNRLLTDAIAVAEDAGRVRVVRAEGPPKARGLYPCPS